MTTLLLLAAGLCFAGVIAWAVYAFRDPAKESLPSLLAWGAIGWWIVPALASAGTGLLLAALLLHGCNQLAAEFSNLGR